jgi:Tfp pilus assembly protein PilP
MTLAALLLVGGCDDQQKKETKESAQAFIQKLKNRMPFINKKQDTRTIKAVTYSAQELNSPFRDQSAKKNTDHKAVLNSEDIRQLKLVGIVIRDNKKWAIVTDKNKTLHALAVNYIVGKQHATVTKISDNSVELKTKTDKNNPYASIFTLTLQE